MYRIAVVGAGTAGLTAAYLLDRKHRVILFERNDYLGGHAQTMTVSEADGERVSLNTGFSVFDDLNYPTFRRLLEDLGLKSERIRTSFGYRSGDRDRICSGHFLCGLLTKGSNLFRPSFYQIPGEVPRFRRTALQDLKRGEELKKLTLEAYFKEKAFSAHLVDDYLVPICSAVWSIPPVKVKDFPAWMFLRFLDQQGLLGGKKKPYRMAVRGGSHTYIQAIANRFKGEIKLNCPIESVRRTEEKVVVRDSAGIEHVFDYAVIATHADEALELLADPTQGERRALEVWSYVRNHGVFHWDPAVMPPRKGTWESWNYSAGRSGQERERVTVTYYLNRLQKLKTKQHYFLTLNPNQPIAPEKIIREFSFSNPFFTLASCEAQRELYYLNGPNRTYYCGSYFGDGFHEAAVRSATEVARIFNILL